ncbi:hypothetical protein ACP4OV_009448 [Aristida adscensionis]
MWGAGADHPLRHGPAAAPSSSAAASSSASSSTAPRSPWQSPVPYLFGGLAAMLGLIALALLALACSYWKLSGSLAAGEPDDRGRRAAGDGGEKGSAGGKARPAGDWRPEHVVVIMAGDERPTFLATPASSRADDAAASCGGGGGSEEGRCVECGARAPARPDDDDGDDDVLSESEQRMQSTSASGSSVISISSRS